MGRYIAHFVAKEAWSVRHRAELVALTGRGEKSAVLDLGRRGSR